MRQVLIASHAHFAPGILESVELLAGKKDDMRAIPFFVDGNDDVAGKVDQVMAELSPDDELVVCTDLLGGSVNNEFLKAAMTHDNVYLVTNMNLPLLLQLALADEDGDTAEMLREIAGSEDTRVKFINDMIGESEVDEEF
jgi:fructoselysine and glucoselysine-specific PTS system IIA component